MSGRMKKQGLLNLIAQLRDKSELDEIDDLRLLEAISLLLRYINDLDIDVAIDEVIM